MPRTPAEILLILKLNTAGCKSKCKSIQHALSYDGFQQVFITVSTLCFQHFWQEKHFLCEDDKSPAINYLRLSKINGLITAIGFYYPPTLQRSRPRGITESDPVHAML